jgi:hypothetical protein
MKGHAKVDISTDVLDEVTDGEGCDALDPPGNSGDNRQDDNDDEEDDGE